MYFAIIYGCDFEVKVSGDKHYPSPLVHGSGELEVKSKVSARWARSEREKFIFWRLFWTLYLPNYDFEKTIINTSIKLFNGVDILLYCDDPESDNEFI